VDTFPLTFESLDTGFGFVLYETETLGGELHLTAVHDRADIFLDQKRVATQMRNEEQPLRIRAGRLSILVENMGRLNYGFDMFDEKGLVRRVVVEGKLKTNWTMTTIPLASVEGIGFGDELPLGVPAFYRATFSVDKVADTFLNPRGFDKGVAFVNGFNLGRYWTIGPQLTLYVPAGILKEGTNELIIFEVGRVKRVKKMSFDDRPQIDTINQKVAKD
jgi:beta-galactosidase